MEIVRAPNRMVRSFYIENYGVTQRGFDGERAWTEEPAYGLEALSGERLAASRREGSLLSPAVRLETLYSDLKVMGSTKDTVLLSATTPEGAIERLAFDRQTNLLVCVEQDELGRDGNRRPVRMSYEDYRAVDGVQVAHSIRFESADLIWTVRLKVVIHNLPVEERRFQMPAR